MSILTHVEAALIDPAITQGRLDGIEAMVRGRTSNHFHAGHSTGPVTLAFAVTLGDLTASAPIRPPFRVGDTVELLECGYSSGLYTVTDAPASGDVTLTGGPAREIGTKAEGSICLVQYPADVVEGVKGLIAYDAERKAVKDAVPIDLKSVSRGRATDTYRDDEMVRTPAGVYPAALLAFLAPHRRLSWGR